LKYVPPPREQQARTFPPFVVVACVCVCVCVYIYTHTHTHTHTRRKIQNTIAQCALCTMPTTGALQLALPRPPTHTARHHHHHHDDDDDDEEEGIGARVCARLHADHLCVCVCVTTTTTPPLPLSLLGDRLLAWQYIYYTHEQTVPTALRPMQPVPPPPPPPRRTTAQPLPRTTTTSSPSVQHTRPHDTGRSAPTIYSQQQQKTTTENKSQARAMPCVQAQPHTRHPAAAAAAAVAQSYSSSRCSSRREPHALLAYAQPTNHTHRTRDTHSLPYNNRETLIPQTQRDGTGSTLGRTAAPVCAPYSTQE